MSKETQCELIQAPKLQLFEATKWPIEKSNKPASQIKSGSQIDSGPRTEPNGQNKSSPPAERDTFSSSDGENTQTMINIAKREMAKK